MVRTKYLTLCDVTNHTIQPLAVCSWSEVLSIWCIYSTSCLKSFSSCSCALNTCVTQRNVFGRLLARTKEKHYGYVIHEWKKYWSRTNRCYYSLISLSVDLIKQFIAAC